MSSIKEGWERWIVQRRRDWRNWSRSHRRLLRKQLNRGEYYSLANPLSAFGWDLEIWATPAVASRVSHGVLYNLIQEAGTRTLGEVKTTEAIATYRLPEGVVGIYLLYPALEPRTEVVIGFAEDECFRALVQAYYRDAVDELAKDGVEITMDNDDGTISDFLLDPVG